MLCEELLLGEPYIIAGAPLARSGKIGYYYCIIGGCAPNYVPSFVTPGRGSLS